MQVPNPFENERLVLLFRVIDALAAEDELPEGYVGAAWRVRDIIFHHLRSYDKPDRYAQNGKPALRPKNRPQYRAFRALYPSQLQSLSGELLSYASRSDDHVLVWTGLRHCLLRLLAKHVGIGAHPKFYRPLFDPAQAILDGQPAAPWACHRSNCIQFVGEEFFSINRYVPEYIEFSSIRLYAAIECSEPNDLWRIDETNPDGEGLLQGCVNLRALKVLANDASVPSPALSRFYNYFRRKEYYWNWYSETGISRLQVIQALTRLKEQILPSVLASELKKAGLLSDEGRMTATSRSLLWPTSAVARAGAALKIGW